MVVVVFVGHANREAKSDTLTVRHGADHLEVAERVAVPAWAAAVFKVGHDGLEELPGAIFGKRDRDLGPVGILDGGRRQSALVVAAFGEHQAQRSRDARRARRHDVRPVGWSGPRQSGARISWRRA
jgi:hypothetical protein